MMMMMTRMMMMVMMMIRPKLKYRRWQNKWGRWKRSTNKRNADYRLPTKNWSWPPRLPTKVNGNY